MSALSVSIIKNKHKLIHFFCQKLHKTLAPICVLSFMLYMYMYEAVMKFKIHVQCSFYFFIQLINYYDYYYYYYFIIFLVSMV